MLFSNHNNQNINYHQSTIKMAGIQSLTVTLFVSLVMVTGVLVGVLSILSGNRATNEAEEAGDKGVQDCFMSSQTNVEEVTDALLDSILSHFRATLLGILRIPEVMTLEMADLISARHPDVATSPDFIHHTLRPLLSAKQRATFKVGVAMIGVLSHDFSPNSDTLSQLNPGGGWGGELILTVADESIATTLPKDRPIWMVLESRSPDYQHFQASKNLMYFWGNHDRRGYMIDDPCVYLPDYVAGQVTGGCPIPYSSFATDSYLETRSRALGDRDQGEVFEKNKPTWSPQVTSGPYLSMALSVPYSHPEMINRYSLQGNRMGAVIMSVTTSEISDLIKDFKLPENSFLYAVERNSWTLETKYLTGSSFGSTVRYTTTQSLGISWPKADPILVTNHSTVNDSNVASVIGRHGESILKNGGYEAARKQSEQEKVVAWMPSLMPNETAPPPEELNSETGMGVLYWTQVQVVETNGLRWYFSLLVPRDTMMKKIDEADRQIRADLAKNKGEASDAKRNDFTIMIIIVAVSVTVLLIVGFFLTKVIITPLQLLEDEMAEVALMKLDTINSDRPLSNLSEVAAMQNSFKRMVSNLKQYREYMPQSVLVDTEEESDAGTETSLHEIKLASDCSDSYSQSGTATSRSKASAAVLRHVVDTQVRKRTVSMILFNVSGFHNIVKGSDINVDVPFSEAHNAVLIAITQAVANNKGVCDTFSGDRVLASFNAVIQCSGSRVSCGLAGVAALATCRLSLPKVRISFACTSGEARIGNMGVPGMKKFAIIGPLVPFVAVLERVNLRFTDSPGVCDKWINDDLNQFVHTRLVSFVFYPKRTEQETRVYQILSKKDVQVEEWMYQLASGSSWNSWDHALEAAFDKQWETAVEMFRKHENAAAADETYKQILPTLENQSFVPLDYSKF